MQDTQNVNININSFLEIRKEIENRTITTQNARKENETERTGPRAAQSNHRKVFLHVPTVANMTDSYFDKEEEEGRCV